MENDQQPEIKKVPFYRMIMDDFMLLLFWELPSMPFLPAVGCYGTFNLPSIPEEIKNNLIK
jgi:hypothetical protein